MAFSSLSVETVGFDVTDIKSQITEKVSPLSFKSRSFSDMKNKIRIELMAEPGINI